VDITFHPEQECTFDDDLLIVCEGDVNKIDRILVKFEADLLLTLSISGLELTSSTSFTFKGIEAQIFWAKATVGAMTFENALVFAPNIMEFEEVRSGSGTRFYCLRQSAPIDYSVVYPAGCAYSSSAGILDPVFGYIPWGYLFFVGYDEQTGPIGNLMMGQFFDATNPIFGFYGLASLLDQPLVFRKKAVEVTLSIAGLTLGLRGLFANFGTALVPSFTVGTVLILEGTTVSGIKVRSETWVGARQGFECFGECKPNQRLGVQNAFIFVPYPATGGIVVSGFQPEEEKLYITGLALAGTRHSILMEMQFNGAGASSLQPTGLFIQSAARVTPLNLSITNIARFSAGLTFVRDQIIFQVSFGDAGGQVVLDFRPNSIGAMETVFTLIYAEFDAPGATASIALVTCDPDEYAGVGGACNIPNFLSYGTPNPFLEVDYDLLFEVGDMTVYLFAATWGSLLKNLYLFSVNASWAIGPVTITSYTAFVNLEADRNSWNGVNAQDPGSANMFDGTQLELAAQQFSIEVKF
jgi:hypothetical protein